MSIDERVLLELDAAQRGLIEAGAAERAAARRRREAVVAASAAGLSRRAVAARLGLSPGRIQQIIDEDLAASA